MSKQLSLQARFYTLAHTRYEQWRVHVYLYTLYLRLLLRLQPVNTRCRIMMILEVSEKNNAMARVYGEMKSDLYL